MTDTYNDSTGSRKKFLIPLVVLLLCAVSLTGAGYAYNATVTSQDNTATIDEVFTIDLYSAEDTVITAPVTAIDVNGLVLTSNKSVAKDGQGSPVVTISGDFELEAMDVVIQPAADKAYTGMFAITADNLARGDDGQGTTTTTTATVECAKVDDNTPYVKFVNGEHYSVTDGSITAEFRFFKDAACTQPCADLESFEVSNTGDPVTYYYFQIVITAVAGTVADTAGHDSAIEFAADAAAEITLEYNFKFTATANEN